MSSSVIHLFQLAFQSALNGLYSTLLLLTIGIVVYQWLELRKSQAQWDEAWDTFKRHTHGRLDELMDSSSLQPDQLEGHHLEDLVADLKVNNEPPPPETTAAGMLQSAWNNHAFLSEQTLQPNRWQRWPGVAVLLGLLGTFIGLTAALTQLPFQGGLNKLTDGLQLVLPVMGTAFWTSVCGLIASLILRSWASKLQDSQQTREDAYQDMYAELITRVRRELYPHLASQGLLQKATRQQGELQPVLEALETHHLTLQGQLLDQWEKAIGEIEATWKPMSELPNHWSSLQEQMSETQSALSGWTDLLAQNTEQIEKTVSVLNASLNPIAHTEELLQERLSGLTRQHEVLTQSIESLLAYEKELPNRLSELLKFSLQPAHRMLQRSSQSLHQSVELVMERTTQEREAWRTEIKSLVDRFQLLERMTQDTANLTRELTQVSNHLAEIADHIRFRPRINPNEAEAPASESLDSEIDQLLEGLSFRQMRESNDESNG